MPTIDVDDITIHYERSGTGPPVLFLHGMCGDAEVFADQAARLSDGYDCIRYDRRGHAASTRGQADLGDARHAADAAALIEALDLAPCLVVASSLGARIAVELMLRRGDLLRGVVLSEPPLFSIDPAARDEAMAEIGPVVAAAEAAGDPTVFVDGFFPVVCGNLWAALDEPGKERYRANGAIGLADLAAPPCQATAQDLATVQVPALVLAGDSSPAFHREICRRLAAALPDVRFVEIERSGHVTYFEQPEAFGEAVATFAAELDRRPAPTGGAAR